MSYWENQAKGGDPMAQYELAKLEEASGNENLKQAAVMHEKAAQQKMPPAMRDLGLIYMQVSKSIFK